MKLTAYFKSESTINLPIEYNHFVQSAIYHSISDKLSAFLHDQGFSVNGRTFKLFSFSRLMGDQRIDHDRKEISFDRKVRLVITSPLPYFMEELANGILLAGKIRLGKNMLSVERLEGSEETVTADSIPVGTLSPITAYSTLLRPDGRKYTVYFAPRDPEYDAMVTNNLRKKYQAATQTGLPDELANAKVRVEPMGQGQMRVVRYKGFIIKGYEGKLKLTGPRPLLQTALDCGLGSKNSQGFGCLAVKK